MATGDILTAIYDEWVANDLDLTVTGGLHEGVAPKGATMPYGVLTMIGSVVESRAASASGSRISSYERVQVQIRVHDNNGPTALSTIANAVKAVFDWAELTLASGSLLYCRRESEVMEMDPDHPNARLWAITYNVVWGDEQLL